MPDRPAPPARVAPEAPIDRAAIDAVLVAAFPGPAEADLVHALRASGDLATSLVADHEGAVVGHVAFSPITIDGAAVPGSGLAPVAVAPGCQRRGIAAALIEAGLAARRDAGDELVVVLGDPAYYARFGFRPARELGLIDTYEGGEAFQAIALVDGRRAPAGTNQVVRYAPAFDALPAGPPIGAPASRLGMILALGANGALGRGGQVPWDLPEDRAHFERTTRGHAVILGRHTWEETGRALPGRLNVVVSRSAEELPGATVVRSLDEALQVAREVDPMPFVIGGRRLFEEALPHVTRLYLTEVPLAPEADVFLVLDRAGLREVASWRGTAGERYVVLDRSRSTSPTRR